jgi:hypothetical protein
MGGCDVADMKRALGMSRSKTYKWYLALFFFMIDVAVINAGVVWSGLKGETAPGRTRKWRIELLMALVAEGRGVDQDFSALSVPQVESSGRKPYTPNQASIVAKLPQSRLVGHHYPTTDPARVATKGQGGSKVGRGQCSVCLRFWGFDRRVTTICGECKVHLCCDGCFLQWHQKEPDWDATFVGWGLNKSKT